MEGGGGYSGGQSTHQSTVLSTDAVELLRHHATNLQIFIQY